MKNYFAVLPLVAASAFAQTDLIARVEVETAAWSVSTYAPSVMPKAMSLVSRIDRVRGGVKIEFSNGDPGSPLQLIASFADARIALDALGCDSYLLVADAPISAVVRFDAQGTYTLTLPLDNPALAGHKIFMQAVSLRKAPSGRVELVTSQGVKFMVPGARRFTPEVGDWTPGRSQANPDTGGWTPAQGRAGFDPERSEFDPRSYLPLSGAERASF